MVRIDKSRAEAEAVPMIARLAQTVAADLLDRSNGVDRAREALSYRGMRRRGWRDSTEGPDSNCNELAHEFPPPIADGYRLIQP